MTCDKSNEAWPLETVTGDKSNEIWPLEKTICDNACAMVRGRRRLSMFVRWLPKTISESSNNANMIKQNRFATNSQTLRSMTTKITYERFNSEHHETTN